MKKKIIYALLTLSAAINVIMINAYLQATHSLERTRHARHVLWQDLCERNKEVERLRKDSAAKAQGTLVREYNARPL